MLAILTLVVWGGYAIFEKRRISKRDIRRIAQNAAVNSAPSNFLVFSSLLFFLLHTLPAAAAVP